VGNDKAEGVRFKLPKTWTLLLTRQVFGGLKMTSYAMKTV